MCDSRGGNGGGVAELKMQWEAPHPGAETSTFSLVEGNKLIIKTKMRLVTGATATYTQVYYRQA
jgi:hypothetical protein